jgi:hypothetical protein
MVRYSTEQHVFLVDDYIRRKKPYYKCVCKFYLQYVDSPFLSKPFSLKLYRKWHDTRSVAVRKRRQPKHVLALGTPQDIQTRLEFTSLPEKRIVPRNWHLRSVLRVTKIQSFVLTEGVPSSTCRSSFET